MASHGLARFGMVRRGSPGGVSLVLALHGRSGQGRRGEFWPGEVSHAEAGDVGWG